jgi:ferredoxin
VDHPLGPRDVLVDPQDHFVYKTPEVVQAAHGVALLVVAQAHGVPLESACEGSLSCSTCNAIVDEGAFAALLSPCEGELEMLEIELELVQTQTAQKPMLRAEVYARALRASKNVKRADMLVVALGLTKTFRLGCCVKVSCATESMALRLPPMTEDELKAVEAAAPLLAPPAPASVPASVKVILESGVTQVKSS